MKMLFATICLFSNLALADWHEPFQVGNRVFDSRNYVAGTVVEAQTAKGNVSVKYDVGGQVRAYTPYYASDLGPVDESQCDATHDLCKGHSFIYTLPVIGKDRKGVVVEVFQGSDGWTSNNRYGKTIYAVQIEGEKQIRFLNSDHLGWMKPL